ncbi:MAG: transketolase family protein [Acidimicrobiales bacterium]
MGDVAAVTGPYESAPFGNTLKELAAARPDIVGVTADMGRYSDFGPFKEAYPERFFNVGMAEQSAVMVGAGLAKAGKTAFVATYSAFLTRRALDFVAIACAHSKANVKIMGGAPGLVNPYGGTHQAIEDLAVISRIPDLCVIDPCDAVELRQVVTAAAAAPGTFYIRNLRGKVPLILDPVTYHFEIGKAQVVREGTDVGVVSTGFMTARALEAAVRVEEDGVSCGVLHVPTIKPFDTAATVAFCEKVSRVVTAENHLRSGGLGSMVIETLYSQSTRRPPVVRVGLADMFHACGSQQYLDARYGLDVDGLTRAILTDRWVDGAGRSG